MDVEVDRVCVDEQWVNIVDQQTYILLHKPPGYLVSAHDPHHTQTVYKLLAGIDARIFPVGRLDLDTSGVLLLTNDGDLAFRLTHPKYGVEKVYRAWVYGYPDEGALRALREGVMLNEGVSSPAEVKVVRKKGDMTELELILHEGRKRQVKQMCAAVGHRVQRLTRTHFAGLNVRELDEGRWRHLAQNEIERLRGLVGF